MKRVTSSTGDKKTTTVKVEQSTQGTQVPDQKKVDNTEEKGFNATVGNCEIHNSFLRIRG